MLLPHLSCWLVSQAYSHQCYRVQLAARRARAQACVQPSYRPAGVAGPAAEGLACMHWALTGQASGDCPSSLFPPTDVPPLQRPDLASPPAQGSGPGSPPSALSLGPSTGPAPLFVPATSLATLRPPAGLPVDWGGFVRGVHPLRPRCEIGGQWVRGRWAVDPPVAMQGEAAQRQWGTCLPGFFPPSLRSFSKGPQYPGWEGGPHIPCLHPGSLGRRAGSGHLALSPAPGQL